MQPNLANAEWLMFRDCPKDQLWHCFFYEFAREHNETTKWMEWAVQKKAVGEPLGRDRLLSAYRDQSASEYPTCLFYTTTGAMLLECVPHFPKRPWLNLPKELRGKLREKFWSTGDRITGEEIRTPRGEPELRLKQMPSSRPLGGKKQFTYEIMVDWSQSDKSLIQRFALWLRRNAPASRDIVEARGSRSPSDLLKQLAALRLSREVTIRAALSYSEKILGTPLYANDQVWSKQRRKAAEFISKEFAL